MGLEFTVVPADVDESRRPDEKPVDYVERVARDKAMAVVAKLGIGAAGDVVVLAADTTVHVDGDVLGKPVTTRMPSGCCGCSPAVRTRSTPRSSRGGSPAPDMLTVTTDVTFVDLDDETIDWYLSTGEYRDKAGAYGMQGAAGALVERVDGSPTNVIGLPLAETVVLLRHSGVRLG